MGFLVIIAKLGVRFRQKIPEHILPCLFDPCLVVSNEMGKTKAKRVSYVDFQPRDRHFIATWRKVKKLYSEGMKRSKIETELKICLHKRTFNRNMKKNYDEPEVNSRSLNRSHKKTDCAEMTQFKQETVRLFNEKNCHGAFGYSFLYLAGNQVREQERFKNNEAIQKLEHRCECGR